jgi:hypothetical protein
MSYIILSPAYGRDYKSAKAVLADFDADKDFVVGSFVSRGRVANKAQLAGYTCEIRYNQFRNLTVVKVGGMK